ncbi:MAG: TPM domain-containing protein [Roseburia sp.]|nr:TPM domain-containing protein [Roseburia sp.]
MRIPNSFKYPALPLLVLLLALLRFLLPGTAPVCAAESEADDVVYTNADTGYSVRINDDADLLTEEEERALCADMRPVTDFGNVLFVSISENPSSAARYAESYYHERCPGQSGTLFLIDMDNRMLWIYSDGSVYRAVTSDYANTITDNVYRYASSGDYYRCASKVYEQIYALLQGQKIAQPMKYISNLFLSLLLALLANYLLVRLLSRTRKPARSELLGSMPIRSSFANLRRTLIHQKKVYVSSSGSSSGHGSSGGGHSRSGGGSSGGGHSHSGGGGGHRF